MANKYLPGGGLNPIWCDEQDAIEEVERISSALENIFDDDSMDADVSLDLGEGVTLNLSKKDYNSDDDNDVDDRNFEDIYEAKFNFIKRHSDNEEDLKLAREILGLAT